MEKVKNSGRNLSIRKSHVIYVAVFAILALVLSVSTASLCNEMIDAIRASYPLSGEKYYLTNEQGEQLGDGTYIGRMPIAYTESDEHTIDMLSVIPVAATPLYSALCIIAAVLLFYKNKLQESPTELMEASRKISQNNLDYSIEYNSKDELEQLCNSFEIMKFLSKNMSPGVNQNMENMYVGYIDINGMKAMMKKMPDDDFQQLCNKIASFVESIVSEHKSYENDLKYTVEFHMFSDNMIFLCRDLNFLIERMGLLQRRFAVCLKLTIKGGIDYGSVYYYKNRFILGKGLVSAYSIDADYHNPAIKIATNLVKDVESRYIKKVSYDEYIVDYYQIAADLSEDFWIEELPYIKEFIEDNLSKEYGEEIRHKYLWLKEYHNEVCKNNGHEDKMIF